MTKYLPLQMHTSAYDQARSPAEAHLLLVDPEHKRGRGRGRGFGLRPANDGHMRPQPGQANRHSR